ncbi:uncharacterized protein CPUR_00180 [Claviceps purpurea 20.1]|uniref:Uncharacterized protein n=1 Tax=Claviceps purpurea (strain 20.1) TaxID=1111077 RepID=M1VXU6_CLAP2|nr:uncharacterized protein CPUR_00180 [Claviceps purpurea 20.1]
MLPRSAQVSRMCLACRLGIAQRPVAFHARLPSSFSTPSQRRLASDTTIYSKERMQALIAGLDEPSSLEAKEKHATKGKSRQRAPKGRPRGRGRIGDTVEESAEWDVEPSSQDKKTAQHFEEEWHEIEPISSENDDIGPPNTVHEGHEGASLRPHRERGRRKKSTRRRLIELESIGVDAQGKPIEILVLNDPNKLVRPFRVLPTMEDETGPGLPLDPQAVYASQDTSFDEVRQNVEEFKPQEKIIRKIEFESLMNSLRDSFTAWQLVAYLNEGTWDHAADVDSEPSFPWILKKSLWKSNEPDPLRWSDLTSKQRRAATILTGKWGLEIQEQVEGLGGSVFWLKPNVFQLITQSSSGIIERLSNDFLDTSKNERISTHLEECRIGVYTGRPNVTTILSRLDEIARSIKSQTISVQQVEQENLTKLVLDELAAITETVLQYDSDNATLDVSWLPTNPLVSGAEQVEGPADVVFRLLVGRQAVPHTTRVLAMSRTEPSVSKNSLFLNYRRGRRGMSWRDKLRQWYRCVNPVGKAVDTETPTLKFAKKVTLPLPKPEEVSPGERAEVVATFGHILLAKPTIRAATLENHARRVLSTRIPHPAALTAATDADVSSSQKTTIVLHFTLDITATATTSTNSPEGAVIPQVRLHVPVDSSSNLSDFSVPDIAALEAIIPWHQSDVLLPEESVDVRLTHTRILPLNSKEQPSLQEFLQASQFNLLQGQLHTPSRTTFSIPNKWLSSSSSTSTTTQQEHTDETTEKPYLFAGLEIQQTVSTEWHGHTLQYSSIEAGQHAGQQQSLSLIAGTPQASNSSDPLTRDQLASFLTLVAQTASGVHFSWDHGHMLMRENPQQEQFSEDMMDEQATDTEQEAAYERA